MFQLRLLSVTAFLAVWFAGLPVGAQTPLSISGLTAPNARATENWYEHHIPARFQGHTRLTIRALSDREIEAYLNGEDSSDGQNASHSGDDGDGEVDGIYEDDPPQITLRLPDNGSLDMFTFAHEYGHYVWFTLLSKDDRRRYEALYKRQRNAHHLVTRYAATDVEEGFAEAFSFYVNEPVLLNHRDSASYEFLSQVRRNA